MPTLVRKSADETVNNSTVQQDDDELFFEMPANSTWFIEVWMFFISTAVADIHCGFSTPAGATVAFGVMNDAANAVRTSDGEFNTTIPGDGGNEMLVIAGTCENGATPGNFQVTWAQATAEATDTEVLAGSYIVAHEA